jgi:hypothetical protein
MSMRKKPENDDNGVFTKRKIGSDSDISRQITDFDSTLNTDLLSIPWN